MRIYSYKNYSFIDKENHIFEKIESGFEKNTDDIHWHNDIEIIYLLKGKLELEQGDRKSQLKESDLAVINNLSFHKLRYSKESSFYRLIINASYLVELFSININKIYFQNHIKEDKKLSPLFMKLDKESKGTEFASNIMTEVIVKEILIELYRNYSEIKENKESHTRLKGKYYLEETLRYIRDHYLEEISIDVIADHVHFSKSYLCTKFKEDTGMTVFQYISSLRIEHAKGLMKQKDYSISKAALESGYNNIPYFSRTFKKLTGLSPSEYLIKSSSKNHISSFQYGKEPKKRKDPYYSSLIAADFSVNWTEKGALTHSHWYSERQNRLKPVRHGYYSSGDTNYLTTTLTYLKTIGVDFLLILNTNGHWNDLGYIARNISNCYKIGEELKDKAPKIAITSGLALRDKNIKLQENENDIIYYEYAKKYPQVYFNLDGKPLLVLMVSESVDMINKIEESRFTTRYGTGLVAQQELLDPTSPNYQELIKKGNYAVVFDRQNPQSELFGVQIGYNQMHRQKVEYLIDRRKGDHYINSWLEAIKAKPRIIKISSYNNHQDETGIEAAVPIRESTKAYPLLYEEDPFLYEKITEGYLGLKHGFIEGFYYKEESSDIVYKFIKKQLKKVTNKEDEEPIIIIPDDYLAWYYDED